MISLDILGVLKEIATECEEHDPCYGCNYLSPNGCAFKERPEKWHDWITERLREHDPGLVLKKAEEIVKHCEAHLNCVGCTFKNSSGECLIGYPLNWNVESIKKDKEEQNGRCKE